MSLYPVRVSLVSRAQVGLGSSAQVGHFHVRQWVLFPCVRWCVRLLEVVSHLCLPSSRFLFPFVGWCVHLLEVFTPLSPGLSPSLSLFLFPFVASGLMCFSPNCVLSGVLNAFLRCPPWCWMVCPPSRGLVSQFVSLLVSGGFILHFSSNSVQLGVLNVFSCVWRCSSKHFLNLPTVWGLRWCNIFFVHLIWDNDRQYSFSGALEPPALENPLLMNVSCYFYGNNI